MGAQPMAPPAIAGGFLQTQNGNITDGAGNRAFQNFYFNTDDIRVALARTWGKLAQLYGEAITMDSDWPIPLLVGLERQFMLAERVAEQYGDVPVWSGEYVKWSEDQDVIDWVNRYAAAEDDHPIGSAYWVWTQACGDPQNGIGPVGDALIMQNCAGPSEIPPKTDILHVLSRAYPQSAPAS